MDVPERSRPGSVNTIYPAEAKSVTVIRRGNFRISSIHACRLGMHNIEKCDYPVIAFDPETSGYALFAGCLVDIF